MIQEHIILTRNAEGHFNLSDMAKAYALIEHRAREQGLEKVWVWQTDPFPKIGDPEHAIVILQWSSAGFFVNKTGLDPVDFQKLGVFHL